MGRDRRGLTYPHGIMGAMTRPVDRHVAIGCGVRSCSQVRTLILQARADTALADLRPIADQVIADGRAEWPLFDDGAEWTMHADDNPRCPRHRDAEWWAECPVHD